MVTKTSDHVSTYEMNGKPLFAKLIVHTIEIIRMETNTTFEVIVAIIS